jgi:hypothetical protein
MTDLFPVFPCDGKGVYPSEAVLSASGARLSWENLRCWAYQAAACTEASSLLDFPAPDVDAPVPSLDALLSEAGEMTRFIEDGGGAPAPPAPQGAPSDA